MGIFEKLFGRSKESRMSEVDRMPFRMQIQNVGSMPKRRTIVTGVIERGSIRAGYWLEVVGGSRPPIKTRVIGIVKNSTIVEEAKTGDWIGCLLKGVQETDIMPGQELTKPGTVGS